MSANPVDIPTKNQDSAVTDGISSAAATGTSTTQIREDLVATAVKFLQNPKVQERPLEQRRAFLERKGMNGAEIELAMLRSGTSATVQTDSSLTVAHPALAAGAHAGAGAPAVIAVPTVVPSSWNRLRDLTNMMILLTGAGYAVYHLYKRFIVPALYGSSSETVKSPDALLEVRRSVDELRRNLADVVAGITETQTLMKAQQRQLDDFIRSNSYQRGADEMERMSVSEVKDELKSLKALLLNRKQFPALPTMAPVIPSWQLQQDYIETDNVLKPSTVPEDCDNNTDHSLTTSVESSRVIGRHATETVTDKLDVIQPDIAQQNLSSDHLSPAAAAAADDDDDNDENITADDECTALTVS